jgi:cation diffusion facilitator CzcD-associated flavoprotein CzcO
MASSKPIPPPAAKRYAKAIIIGTGFSGLAAAIRMKQQQDDDFIVLERAGDVGGVWRDNRYPGCGCDVQSHLYSYSFAPNPHWNREYSPQPEIRAYLRHCAETFGVIWHIRFNTTVQRLTWDENAGEWIITTDAGEYRARYVFAGMGSLSEPMMPRMEGLDDFKGRVIHSAMWPKDLELAGKCVAVIGTGASAIQFIPNIQPLASILYVFQRTAAWVVPRHDFVISEKAKRRYLRFPLLQRLVRRKLYLQREWLAFGFRHPAVMRLIQIKAVQHMHKAISDPELRKKLTPAYTLGCKRILISNDYYPALAKPNVEVVTSGIQRATERGVLDGNGIERPVDIIIFGTGFQVRDLPYSHWIYGRQGVSLSDAWKGSPVSLSSTTVNGFPNLFLLYGPNTGLGHTSMVYMLETQVEHALRLMRYAERSGPTIEPRAEAQQQYVEWVDQQMKGTVWTAGGCDSWYLDRTGRNSALWPSYTFTFRSRLSHIRFEDYELRKSGKVTMESAPVSEPLH